MFSDDFRQRLEWGKYTKWAASLTEEQLEALLWMIGEFGFRAPPVLMLVEKHTEEFAFYQVGFARAKLALHTIWRVFNGERLDVNEAKRRVREIVDQARSSRNGSA